MPDSLLRRLKRRLRPSPPTAGPPAWQRIHSGPLAGLELYLPTDERPTSWITRILNGSYEERLLHEVGSLAERGGTFFDIGGHVGFFACAWLRLGGDNVEVFEPMPDNARRIEETLARNELGGRVHHLALGDQDGQATLVHNITDIGLASMSHLEAHGGVPKMQRQTTNSRVTVEVRRLDGLVEGLPAPAVVKIDVEGAEGAVVEGAAELLAKARPVVFCELHGIEPTARAVSQLTRLGYVGAALDAKSGMPVYRFDPQTR